MIRHQRRLNRRTWFTLLVVSACCGCRSADAWQPASENPPLRWQLQPGQQFKISFTQTLDTVTTAGKNAARVRMEFAADLHWIVQSVEDNGDMQIEQSIARLAMKLSRRGGTDPEDKIEYDSSSAETPRGPARDIAAAAGPLVGLKVQLTFSPRGEVMAVRIPDESRETIEQIRDRSKVTTLVTPEGIADILKQAMPLLPKEAIDVGESWQQDSKKVTSVGELQQTMTFTYEGPDAQLNGWSRIALVGTVQLAATPDSQLKMKSQQMSGKLWFDQQQQRMVRGSVQQEIVTESPYRDTLVNTRLGIQLEFTIEPLE